MKWFFLILAILIVVYIILPNLSATTRFGEKAIGGGNGNAAQYVA